MTDSELKKLIKKFQDAPDLMVDEISTVNGRTSHGDQLIHFASISGNASDLNALIGLGADINSIGELGYTPLHYACEQGNFEAVKFLLANGADITITDEGGETAIQMAKNGGYFDIVNEIENGQKSDIYRRSPRCQGNTSLWHL